MKKEPQIIKKQSLIDKTRKSVILIVAGASIVVGALVVVCGILIQHLMFNTKVIAEQNNTIEIIEANTAQINELEADLRVLNTNEQLMEARSSSDAEALQTVLDALPADPNRLALGASLEQRIFHGLPGLTVQSLSVDSSAGSSGASLQSAGGGDGLGALLFSASISGTPDTLQLSLERLQQSIRAMNVTRINGTAAGNSVTFNITGETYYLQPVDLSLGSKEVSSR